MNRVFIVHCWEGYPEYCWYPSIKQALEKEKVEVIIPAFPHTERPTQVDWVPFLAQHVGVVDENTYLVGHSVGCITILRYLEILKENEKIGGAILVAGFTDDLGYKELSNFFVEPIDFEKIKNHCPRFVSIHSDNDPYVDLKFGNVFEQRLGAREIILHNRGHFSGPADDEKSCTELPEVVEQLQEMMR